MYEHPKHLYGIDTKDEAELLVVEQTSVVVENTYP